MVIPLLDLKCPLAQISGMFGLSMKEVKTISSDYELIRKINNIKFTKKCLEVSDFSKTQTKLRLNHIQTLLYHIIQKFSSSVNSPMRKPKLEKDELLEIFAKIVLEYL